MIVLLGTGWSFLKPFLSDRDKKLLLVLLPMQIIVNVAIAFIEETSEGNVSWSNWATILKFVDVACCVMVLLPVVWSIKDLGDSAATSGKARRNLRRMQQFRTFYLAAVVFIYFTRVVVPFVESSVPYDLSWTPFFLYESAALLFYTYSGNMFKPTAIPWDSVPQGMVDEPQVEQRIVQQMMAHDVEEIELVGSAVPTNSRRS